MKKADDKSFWNPNREFSEVISRLADAVEASKSVAILQLTWFKETQGAITKRDLDKGLKQLKDDILQELKGNMASLKEQLDAQEAQLTAIAEDVDGIVASVTGINTDVQALKKQIDDLNNSPGELTPENQEALNRIQVLAGSIATKTAAAKTAAAELDAATANGSGDGGPTPT